MEHQTIQPHQIHHHIIQVSNFKFYTYTLFIHLSNIHLSLSSLIALTNWVQACPKNLLVRIVLVRTGENPTLAGIVYVLIHISPQMTTHAPYIQQLSIHTNCSILHISLFDHTVRMQP